jgi:hypothetical protein
MIRERHRRPGTAADYLGETWRLYSAGRDDDARASLTRLWTSMELSTSQEVRLALRLFERLKPVTDETAAWEALPSEFLVYRPSNGPGGMGRGHVSWTLSEGHAEQLAELLRAVKVSQRMGLLTRVESARVLKSDVLAYFRSHGEEIVVSQRDTRHEAMRVHPVRFVPL